MIEYIIRGSMSIFKHINKEGIIISIITGGLIGYLGFRFDWPLDIIIVIICLVVVTRERI